MPTSNLPRPILRVIGRGIVNLKSLMDRLRGGMSVSQWRNDFAAEMKSLHQQALATGNPTINNARQATTYLDKVMEAQLGFLDRWTIEIEQSPEFNEGWVARSALYALSVKQDYWTGATHFLPLPAMPGDGTSQCLGNCGCSWRIVWIDEANGDADAYWVRGKDDSCQTCKIRANDWNPLRIRAGDLLVTKAWPKGRHLSAAHRRAISIALRRRHNSGGGSAAASSGLQPAPLNDDQKAAKAARAKRRREAAKAQSTGTATTTAAKDTVIKPKAGEPKPKDTAADKIAQQREAKRLRAQKRREAAKHQDASTVKVEPPKPTFLTKQDELNHLNKNYPDPAKFKSQSEYTAAHQAHTSRITQLRQQIRAEQPKPEKAPRLGQLMNNYPEMRDYATRDEWLKAHNAHQDKIDAIVTRNKREKYIQAGDEFARSGRNPVTHVMKGSDFSDSAQTRVELGYYNSLPKHVKDQLAATDLKIYMSSTKSLPQQDSNQDMLREAPRGWTPGSTFHEVGGVYEPRKNQISTSFAPGARGASTSGSVLLHETGHAMGDRLGYDNAPRVKELYDQQVKYGNLSPYLLQPPPAGRQEFWAEAFSTTVTNPTLARQLYGDGIVDYVQKEVLEPPK